MDQGLYYYGSDIVYKDDTLQNQEYNKCYNCLPGFKYIKQTNECAKCPTGCLDCNLKKDGLTTYCLECDTGYALDEYLNCLLCEKLMSYCITCFRAIGTYNIS